LIAIDRSTWIELHHWVGLPPAAVIVITSA
jgi:hypothetical protein